MKLTKWLVLTYYQYHYLCKELNFNMFLTAWSKLHPLPANDNSVYLCSLCRQWSASSSMQSEHGLHCSLFGQLFFQFLPQLMKNGIVQTERRIGHFFRNLAGKRLISKSTIVSDILFNFLDSWRCRNGSFEGSAGACAEKMHTR